MVLPRALRERRYSTPRLLLGADRQAAPAASCRAAGKDRPRPRAERSFSGYSGASRAAAAAASGASSPVSLPKESTSTTPVAASRDTAPRAKDSAEAMAQGVGSSTTRSAPRSRARAARSHLSARAHSPR